MSALACPDCGARGYDLENQFCPTCEREDALREPAPITRDELLDIILGI